MGSLSYTHNFVAYQFLAQKIMNFTLSFLSILLLGVSAMQDTSTNVPAHETQTSGLLREGGMHPVTKIRNPVKQKWPCMGGEKCPHCKQDHGSDYSLHIHMPDRGHFECPEVKRFRNAALQKEHTESQKQVLGRLSALARARRSK